MGEVTGRNTTPRVLMAILSSLLSLAMQKAEGDLGLCEGKTYDADGTDMLTSCADTAKADVHLGRSEREKYMIEEMMIFVLF